MHIRFLTTALLFILTAHSSLAQDSLDVKIGQMLLFGIPGPEIDDMVLKGVMEGKVGSIILFEKNIPVKNSYISLKKITWTYQQSSAIPLLISIDQEGGRVNRLKTRYTFPRSVSAAKLGKMPLDSVRFYGETTAATLAGLGINLNFAPVVDVAFNPDNPIIAKIERSFSSDPDSVTLYAKEFIAQHRKLGVLTVLKHFPGHGSSREDTHLEITDVTNVWSEKELIPYRSLIQSGYVDAIMTAHIVNKKLDESGNPGTLSPKVVTDLLRKKLNYDGVVFSDDMHMQAIAKYYGLEQSIKMAILAGVDILCFSNNVVENQKVKVDQVHGIIRKLVDDGAVSRGRIDESYKRVMKLKSRLGGSTSERLQEAQTEAQRFRQIAEANEKLVIEIKNKVTELEKSINDENSKKKKRKKRKSDKK